MHPRFLTPLDRRELLKRGLVVASIGAVPSFLAACGGDGGGGEAAAPATTGAAEATPAVPEASGTIDYLSWEGYDIPDPMAAWKEENGVAVESTYIGNHDEIQAKIQAGGGSYDLITYYQGYKELYTELDILTPIDTNKIPNIENEYPVFRQPDDRNLWIEADGTWTGVPWTWGSIGITWDDEALPGGLESWYDLLDPKFKDKIGVINDPLGAFTLTAHILGYDPSTVTEEQLKEIVDLATQFVKQAKSIAPSFGDMTTQLVSGEIVVCYQGWAYQNYLAAEAGKTTVKTKVPTEGSFSFCDVWAIPSTTDNADTVHAWINETLDPERNARIAEFLVAAVTVEGAVDLLNEETRALYPYDDLELGDTTGERLAALFELAPFYANLPVESDEYVTFSEWTETWEEIKANA
jgi:spermidine/putrescine transport system substrate-binding protein